MGSFTSIISAKPPLSRGRASVYQRTTGAVLPPLSAFLLLQGIETLHLRVERHVANARGSPNSSRDPRVAWVELRGIFRQSQFRAGQKIFQRPRSVAAHVRRERRARRGKAVYDALRLVKRLVNIGDAKSLACHPASTTHRQMSLAEQANAGVSPEMIRLSIGIEHIDDIIEDLDQGLAAMAHAAPRLAAQGVV